jgi:ribosomal protein S18 acetylase RimI-like enzyme
MDLLDNPAWAALTTHQAHLAVGGQLARRFPTTVTPIAAVGRPERAALDELATLVTPGDWISLPATLPGLVPLLPPTFRVTLDKALVQMVCKGRWDAPAIGCELQPLAERDIPDMLALTSLTHPGPFRSQTYTLGTYLGVHVDGRLVAMGGERMLMPGYREISAICTHPDFEGRGLARTIVAHLVGKAFDEGLTPFLHVEETNLRAQALYKSLGFVERARLPLLVVEREAGRDSGIAP